MPRTCHKGILTLVMVLCALSSQIVFAQNGETVSLRDYLTELEAQFQIRFSYADAILEGVRIKRPIAPNLTEILADITKQTVLEIKPISERYYALLSSKKVSLCGKVLDNYAENTVPGATVEVLGSGEAMVTDAEGNFSMEEVDPRASLQIRYLGYLTKIVPVLEVLKQSGCGQILLAERREPLKEVVVYEFLTKGITKELDGSIRLNTKEMGLLPGSAEPDVLFGVQALPGIKSVDETVSDINIRGGTNDQNLILWNGIKMYQSGHFFGLISAFNPYLTENVSIYKNGTPAEYGDGVSGLIHMQTKNTIEDAFTGGAGLNFISGDFFGQLPINDKLAFQFSARRSITYFLNTPAYESFTDRVFQDTEVRNAQNQQINENLVQEENFSFYDFSGKLLYDLHPGHALRLSFIAMDNRLEYTETTTGTNASSQSFLDQDNLAAGLQWAAHWNHRFSTHATAYYTQYTLDAQAFFPDQEQRLDQRNVVEEAAIKLLATQTFSDRWSWNGGYQFVETGVTNDAFVSQPPFDSSGKEVVRVHAAFTDVTFAASDDRFVIQPGLRVNRIENLGTFSKWTWEPRLNLNMKLANYWRLQLLGEYKSQYTNQVVDLEQNFLGIEKRRWTLSNESDLPLTQSKQGSLGLNYAKNRFYMGLEGFYKSVDGISTETQGFQNENQFDGELGSYAARGLEFLINHKGTNYSAWLSYSYAKNDYTYDSLVPMEFPNNLDIRHTLSFAGTYSLKSFKFGLGINYRSGRPYTQPLADNALDETVFPAQINFDSPNSSRLPGYFRADASATYAFPLSRRLRAKAGVSLLNLTNRDNILNRYYRVSDANEVEQVDRISLGLTPNISFRVAF